MSAYNDRTEAEAIRLLAEHTLPIRDHMISAAVKYNVNIITGSMPLVEKGRLLNVGFLCQARWDLGTVRQDASHPMGAGRGGSPAGMVSA